MILSSIVGEGLPFAGIGLSYAPSVTTLRKQDAPRMLDTGTGEPLLTTAEAASALGLSPRTLEGLRRKGGGPAFVAISRNLVRYQPAALSAWIDSRSVPHTAKARSILAT